MLDETRQKELEKILQQELIQFLGANCNEYIFLKKLTPKKIELICEFVDYMKHKIDGKTSEQRAMEVLDRIFEKTKI